MGDLSAARSGGPGLPEALRRISAVVISIDPPAVAPPASDTRTITLLQRARAFGVTTFDVSSSRYPDRAERLIARAFPDPDPQISVIVGRSLESLARERGEAHDRPSTADLPAALSSSLSESRRRLAPIAIGVVDWEAGDERLVPPARDPSSTSGGESPMVAIRLAPDARGPAESWGEHRLFSGEFSLLEPELGELFEMKSQLLGSFLIARDPFAGGRLDGSRFGSEVTLGGPPAPPVDIRRLHEEYDPVVRLGFLTRGHRRTLAQAALRFTLQWPWVAAVVVPLPQPERFDEVMAFGSTPPISPDELDNIRRLK